HDTKVRGARIVRAVDAMAHTRNFDLVGQHFVHFFDGFIGRTYLQQQLDHVFVGAAVERSFEGPDGRGDGRVDIRESCGGDAGGEGGSVEFVVGVQNERDVENMLHDVVWLLAGEAIEEVACKA